MISVHAGLLISALAILFLLWLLRRDRLSLGLPVAYMIGLLLIHVPGAWAYVASRGVYGGYPVAVGFSLTVIGILCFLVGVVLARPVIATFKDRRRSPKSRARPAHAAAPVYRVRPKEFWLFCLFGGWFLIYGVGIVLRIPSVSAAVQMGGALWMLGVMLGLADALHRRAMTEAVLWVSALAVFPVLVLLLGGFLSYGSAAAIIVFSFLLISERRYWRAAVTLILAAMFGMSVFVNYFAARNDLRAQVWGGQAMSARVAVVEGMVEHFRWFDPKNPAHLDALDKRLNQNYFVGVAADRLERGQTDFLHGESLIDGALALIPRALWPDKPVAAGSGDLVREVTGLNLNLDTSWGVGNVLEFYMNFGVPGLVIGFVLLGLVLAILDRRAAMALQAGELGSVFLYFLPAVALIQPNGSMVELAGGSAAALVAGFFWRSVWAAWVARKGRAAAVRMVRPQRF